MNIADPTRRPSHDRPAHAATTATRPRLLRCGGALWAGAALGLTAVTIPASASTAHADDAARYGRALFAVDGVGTDDVWAVGLGRDIRAAIWHWDGSQWAESSHPRSTYQSSFSDVSARTADDVWAAGSTETGSGLQVAYAQHWNGRRWRMVAADPGLVTSGANAVTTLAEDDAWIVGDAQGSVSGNVVALIEHWDGRHWASVEGARTGRGCDVSLNGVTAVAEDDVWAVGTQICAAASVPLVEHWDGRRWSKVDVPAPRRAKSVGLEEVTAITADDVWAVGSFARSATEPGRNLALHWNGTRWALVSAPNPGRASCSHVLSGISGSSADDVWASSTRSCATAVAPEMLHWDGTRWSDVEIPSSGFDDPPRDGLTAVLSLSKRSAFTVGIATTPTSIEVGFIERWNGRLWSLQ
jgi:hypothetical protein